MKLISLSEKILRIMVNDYSDFGNRYFNFEFFKNLYPDLSDDFISDSLYLLQSDGFVSVLSADNVAYTTALLPQGVRNCEVNTMLKKGYTIIKEIRSLI